MYFNNIVLALLLSLITGVVIFSHSPSDKYSLATKPKTFNTDNPLLDKSAILSIKFTDLTLQSGLFFTHQQGDHSLSGINESLGSGVCVFDYDNDGWQDLFMVNGSGQNRYYGRLHWWQNPQTHQLFKNTDGTSFTRVTGKTGLKIRSWGMGCISADFNNDGFNDLLITNIGVNQLFKNNGNGTFSEIKNFSSPFLPAWSTSACSADFDGDGLLDLYIANYIDFDKTKLNYEGQSEFASASNEFFNPLLFNPAPNRLYKNTGNFSFIDITESSGLLDTASRSLAIRCQDINNDSLPDIIVGNDKGEGSNRLYINQGQFNFTDFSKLYRFQNNSGSHSIDIGDINNDGQEEIIMTSGILENMHLYQGDFSNIQTTDISDIARSWGLTENISNFQANWGGGLHDFNQDGRLDFFVVNGFLAPDFDAPHTAKGQPNQLWVNTGKNFLSLSLVNTQPPSVTIEPSRSSVFADFDNDGDMDIYISNNNNLGQLLVNQSSSGAHWLGVYLTDNKTRKNMIAAKVSITSKLGIQSRTISAGDSFLSDSEDRLLFGLGSDTSIKKLTIRWPNGHTSHLNDFSIDRYIQIDITDGLMPYIASSAIKPNQINFSVADPDYVTLYLSLFSKQHGFNKALPYFNKALASSNSEVKKVAIEQLALQIHPESIALLVNSLKDKSNDVAVLALQKLCAFEEESTIRWLISALADSRDTIRKTAANCFEFLFYEEEAMIHRKYLALPSLIYLLSDSDPEVQIAAIRALAKAEHYRAVDPLIKLLDSSNPEIRSEAAKSLGLIREKKAEQALVNVFNDIDKSPEVIAQSFIALKRLNYKNLKTTLEVFFQGSKPFNTLSKEYRADVLTALSRYIVIPPQFIAKNAASLIAHNKSDEKLVLQLIPLMDNADEQQSSLLMQLIKSPNQYIRLKAFEALLIGDTENRLILIKQALNDSSDLVINQLFSKLTDQQMAISADYFYPLLKNKATSITAIQLLAKINNRDSAKILAKELLTSPHKALILQSLALNSFANFQRSEPYLTSSNDEIKKAAFRYYLQKQPTNKLLKTIPVIYSQALENETQEIRNIALHALTQRKELWALRKSEKIILDINEIDAIRLELIKEFKHPFQKKHAILLKIAKNINDPIRVQIMELLIHFDEEPSVINFLKAEVFNSETHNTHRLMLLKVLAKKHPKWTLDFLINHHSQ